MSHPETFPGDYAASEEMLKPGEACGVFGIYAPGMPTKELTYLGLESLQHRGQAGAGIMVSDGTNLYPYVEMGRVSQAFDGGAHLKGLPTGDIVTGHTRYPTAKNEHPVDPEEEKRREFLSLQPMRYSASDETQFSIAHNGHVEGLDEVADQFGVYIGNRVSDTDGIRDIIGHVFEESGNLIHALSETLPHFKGAYSLVLSTPTELIAARDPRGFRPLHIGRIGQDGYVVASEISALDIVGAEPFREVQPGEIVRINEKGLESTEFADADPALCAFEFVYFSRPENEMFGEVVADVRERMGMLLAQGDDIEADIVMGVPESGRHAANGYAWESGVRLRDGLVRNNYVDRSFIADSQNARVQKVRNKLNPIRSFVKDKSVVVVDDSIVRGTTMEILVGMLREAGAREIHLRISSPPYKWPCFYGMDTSRESELIAANLDEEAIRTQLGVDTLKYLSNDQLQKAVGGAMGKICTACTTGVYPYVPVTIRR